MLNTLQKFNAEKLSGVDGRGICGGNVDQRSIYILTGRFTPTAIVASHRVNKFKNAAEIGKAVGGRLVDGRGIHF